MKNFVVLILISLSFVVVGQEKTPVFLTFTSKGGILMAHHPYMAHLIQKNAYGFELSLAKQQVESSYNANRHKFPINGLSFEYRNFGNDDVLGKAYSLIQYQDFSIFQTLKNLSLSFKFGTGLGYLTKSYHKDYNPTNNAIGSHFNAKVSLKFELMKYTKRMHFGIGTELSHFSNGSMQTPNLGLNNLSTYINIGYNFNEKQLYSVRTPYLDLTEDAKSYFLGEGILSVAEVAPVPLDAKKYLVAAGRISYIKPKNKSWNYELAIDFVYNASNLHRYYDSTFTKVDVTQVGVYGGMSLNYYKSQIIFGMGFYFLDKINPLGRIYNRVGYRYFFKPNWCGLFNIRASFGRADFFEFGVGYKF